MLIVDSFTGITSKTVKFNKKCNRLAFRIEDSATFNPNTIKLGIEKQDPTGGATATIAPATTPLIALAEHTALNEDACIELVFDVEAGTIAATKQLRCSVEICENGGLVHKKDEETVLTISGLATTQTVYIYAMETPIDGDKPLLYNIISTETRKELDIDVSNFKTLQIPINAAFTKLMVFFPNGNNITMLPDEIEEHMRNENGIMYVITDNDKQISGVKVQGMYYYNLGVEAAQSVRIYTDGTALDLISQK